MCIIAGSLGPEGVSKTRIMVAPAERGEAQITAYSNKVSMQDEGGAMILPFPGRRLDFVPPEVWDATKLFENLDDLIPKTKSRGVSRGRNMDMSLDIVDVGSYQCSVAHSVDDLKRIKRAFFELPDHCYEFLADKYPEGFGFLVCKLRRNAVYHPLVYKTAMSPDRRMFVPTMHYHVHGDDSAGSAPQVTSDWHHDIYALGALVDITVYESASELRKWPNRSDRASSRTSPGLVDFVRSGRACGLADRLDDLSLERLRIVDYDDNHDLWTHPVE